MPVAVAARPAAIPPFEEIGSTWALDTGGVTMTKIEFDNVVNRADTSTSRARPVSTETDRDNDYPTCARTYATLRIYRDDLDPNSVTRLLGVEPTRTQVKGWSCTGASGRTFTPEVGGWFLSTKGQVESKDVCRHLDWLAAKLAGRDDALQLLRAEGHRMDVFCYWLSAEGHGGPMLSPEIMRRFGELELQVGFDVYG
jgi:hypothetical protein